MGHRSITVRSMFGVQCDLVLQRDSRRPGVIVPGADGVIWGAATRVSHPTGQMQLPLCTIAINVARNPLQEFIFNKGTPNKRHVFSPDIGRRRLPESRIWTIRPLATSTHTKSSVTGHP